MTNSIVQRMAILLLVWFGCSQAVCSVSPDPVNDPELFASEDALLMSNQSFDFVNVLVENDLKRFADSNSLLTLCALGAYRNEEYSKAIELFSKAIVLAPTKRVNFELRAKCYEKIGNSELADADKATALSLPEPPTHNPVVPNDSGLTPEAQEIKDLFESTQKNQNKELKELTDALKTNASDVASLKNRASIFLELEMPAHALVDLKHALSLQENAELYKLRARSYRALGLTSLAKADEDKAKQL